MKDFIRNLFRRPLTFFILLLILGGGLYASGSGVRKNDKIPVGITGYQHLGSKFNISKFYVNGYYASNVGRGGGGGSNVCCVILPNKWREGITVEVRWSINDWSQENRAEMAAGNYDSLRWGGSYLAIVPVEKYDEPGQLFVHFFPGGRVRVISSNFDYRHVLYPIHENDPNAADGATKGVARYDTYTEEELEELERKAKNNRTNWVIRWLRRFP